ncbi:MAG: hypothetical protein ACWGSD_02310 [Thermodesulfobacteriota bacterium]
MTRSRRLFVVGAMIFVILGAGTGIGSAEEEKESLPRPDFGVDLTFVNKYVWRGMLLTDGPVFQPAATLGYKGATVNVWGNLDLNDVNDLAGEFNEIDLTLDYTHTIKEFSVSGGLIYYDFPNTDFNSTLELYVAGGIDILLQPTLTVYFDVDQVEGIYGTLGFSHSFDLPDLDSVSWSLDLATSVGLGSVQYVDYAFTDFYAEASLPITIFDQLTISPYMGVTVVLDTALRAQTEQSDNFLVGATLSWSI